MTREELVNVKEDIDKLNARIKDKRRELDMVKDIKNRSEELAEKTRELRETDRSNERFKEQKDKEEE